MLPFAATAFGTFLIRQGFRGLPPEIQDATRLDGYGHLAFLWRFAVPLTRPVIASFTVIVGPRRLEPVPVAPGGHRRRRPPDGADPLRGHRGHRGRQRQRTIAAALMVALPVVLLLIAFQRQIIRGLTAGAVKG